MIFEEEFGDGKWELPEILDYEEYTYNKSCICDKCSYHLLHPEANDEGIVGYCSTNNGHFICFVCPNCGAKYRYHFSKDGEKFGDFEEWKKNVAMALSLGDYEHFRIK